MNWTVKLRWTCLKILRNPVKDPAAYLKSWWSLTAIQQMAGVMRHISEDSVAKHETGRYYCIKNMPTVITQTLTSRSWSMSCLLLYLPEAFLSNSEE